MDIREIVYYFIILIIILIFIYGVCFAFLEQINYAFWKYKLHRSALSERRINKYDGKIHNHLAKLICSFGIKKINVKRFEKLTITLFISVFIITIFSFPVFNSFIISLAFATMPYVILRIKLEGNRKKSSLEGESLVINILTQYRINNFNIFETLNSLVLHCNDLRTSKKIIFILLMSIRNTGSEEKIIEATKVFAYSINTNWSRMLGNNIQIAATRGIDISNALEDVLIQLRIAKSQLEERKRLNSESVRMTLVMVPLLYFLTVFMSIKYLDLSLLDLIKNQFKTSEGLTLFLLSLLLLLINHVLIDLVNNQSFDY
jgi:hypothetical protein